jgi:hypothetical protein
MLDTVNIKIAGNNSFFVDRRDNFSPEFKRRIYSELSETEKRQDKKTFYTAKFVLKKGILLDEYQPRVEIYEDVDYEKREISYVLKIEFSNSKLLLENSILEIKEDDQPRIMQLLEIKLRSCGIRLNGDRLPYATVGKVHFAKNIILPDNILMANILEEFSKASMGKSYDITKTKHTNTSETLQHFCGSRDHSFYDKVRDILRPQNKSTDKEKTSYEKELIYTYNLEKKSIFRYEYRLNRIETIKSEINKFYKRQYKEVILFKDLFSEALWKEMIIKSWDRIIQKPTNQLALRFSLEDGDIFKHMLVQSKQSKKDGHSQNIALTSFGLATLAKKYGIAFIRSEYKKIWSDRACGERLDRKIEEAEKLLTGLPYSDDIAFVDKAMRDFKRITLDNLEEAV